MSPIGTDVRLVWQPRPQSVGLKMLRFFRGPPSSQLQRAIERFGDPRPNVPLSTLSALDEAKLLLCTAASVEHALMTEYLYSAYSIDSDLATKLKPIFGQRGPLIQIAVQEMGHFVAVQNLLLLTGAEPYLARQDQAPPMDGDPFEFMLEPFSLQSLAKYLLAESPAFFAALPDDIKQFIRHALSKLGENQFAPHPVGIIYAKLYWLMQSDDNPTNDWPEVAQAYQSDQDYRGRHVDPSALVATSASYQTLVQEWGDYASSWNLTVGKNPISNLADARGLLRDIAQQGEGYADNAESHFRAFAKVQTAVTDWNGAFAKAVPINPSVRAAADGSATQITNTTSIAFAIVFNAIYTLLLTFISAGLALPRRDADDDLRKYLFNEGVFSCGMMLLKELGKDLVDMPLSDPANAMRAGPPFELDRIIGGTSEAVAKPSVLAGIDSALSVTATALNTPGLSQIQSATLSSVKEHLEATRIAVDGLTTGVNA